MSKLNEDRVARSMPGAFIAGRIWMNCFSMMAPSWPVSRASMLRGKENPTDPHAFFGTDRRGIRTEMGETVEIDHQRDLYLAEAVLRERGIQKMKVAI